MLDSIFTSLSPFWGLKGPNDSGKGWGRLQLTVSLPFWCVTKKELEVASSLCDLVERMGSGVKRWGIHCLLPIPLNRLRVSSASSTSLNLREMKCGALTQHPAGQGGAHVIFSRFCPFPFPQSSVLSISALPQEGQFPCAKPGAAADQDRVWQWPGRVLGNRLCEETSHCALRGIDESAWREKGRDQPWRGQGSIAPTTTTARHQQKWWHTGLEYPEDAQKSFSKPLPLRLKIPLHPTRHLTNILSRSWGPGQHWSRMLQ